MTAGIHILAGLIFIAAWKSSQAATITIRHTILEDPYLWQGLEIGDDGELYDRWGSKNIDVDGDGSDDFGFFIAGAGELLFLTSFEGQALVRRISGPSDPSGVAARFDAGSIIGSESVSSLHTYYSISPHAPYYHPEDTDWGEWTLNFDEPLPRDVIVTGSLNGWTSSLWQGNSGYLGFRLLEEDGWHYGWIYIERDPALTVIGGYVMSYAYETEPNKAIIAGGIPEPSSALLLGSAAIAIAKRRKRIGGIMAIP